MTGPQSIMIFAAGLGTRMRPLTEQMPKPLIPVGGKTLLDHALDLVTPLGLMRQVVNLHYKGDMIRAHLAGRTITFSDETEDLLDTGGGLRKALPLLGPEPVFTLNTDAVWRGGNPLEELRTAWDPARMDALLLLVRPERAVGHKGRGDFLTDKQGRLRRGPGPIYAGAQILRTDGLADIPDRAFSLNLLWDQMLNKGRLFGLVSDLHWCDVGQPESLPLAEAMLGAAHV